MKKPYSLIDLETLTTQNKVVFIQFYLKTLKMGSAIAFGMGEYYNIEDFTLSPILYTKDKNFIKRFWLDLTAQLSFTWDEFRFLASLIVDNKGISYDCLFPINPVNRDVKNNVSMSQLIMIFDGVSDVLTDFHLKQIEECDVKSNLLIEEAKRNPTISNIMYLIRHKEL